LKERKVKKTKPLIKKTIIGVVIFLFLMSPLAIFDARHGWNNFGAMKKFFTVRQETVSIKPWKAIPNSLPISEKIMMRLVGANQANTGPYILGAMVALSVWFLVLKRKDLPLKTKHGFYVLLVWLGVAILGLGLYKQEIYDHYYGFFFPAPFLLIGGLGQLLLENKKRIIPTLTIIALVLLVYVNLKVDPLLKAPNQQLRRAREVAQKIKEEANGERFNLAVLAERNYEDGYQYFLERWNEKVVDINALKADETITQQLFVVCELPKEKCDPTHSPKAEVANFGWSKIENEWEVFGARLYKLVHTQP